ncbi:MAG: hypothetical protein M3237_05925 [Actinomycetota bacterium]|nr:hypothetical protein [Actinomycetota bacterium]
MTTAVPPPPPDDAADEPADDDRGDTQVAAARAVAADAARLAAEVRAHEEHLARLRAEARAHAADGARLAAEARVRELEARLAAVAEELAAEEEDDGSRPVDPNTLSLFDDPQPVAAPSLAPDGSDPGVLPMALIGTAVVAGMAAILAFVNGRAGFGIFMLGITVLLLWFASATWVTPIEVSVDRGIVYVDEGSSKHRFDLRNERTKVEISGQPGESDWEVRFVRRGLDPFVIRDGMVDARAFVGQLREWRPEL